MTPPHPAEPAVVIASVLAAALVVFSALDFGFAGWLLGRRVFAARWFHPGEHPYPPALCATAGPAVTLLVVQDPVLAAALAAFTSAWLSSRYFRAHAAACESRGLPPDGRN